MSKSNIYTGSRLIVEKNTILDFVSSLKNSINTNLKKNNNIVDIHNNYALYTLQMLVFISAHRAVTDPLHSIDIFDRKSNFIFIDDKAISSSHSGRIVLVPDIAFEQLDLYISHITSLSNYFFETNRDLSDKLLLITRPQSKRPLPLFFFLNPDYSVLRITPSILQSAIDNYWPLEKNSHRHILSSWLHNNKCPHEFISSQLGHIEKGCSPYGKYSVLQPSYMKEQLLPFLEAFMKECSWNTIPSPLNFYRKSNKKRRPVKKNVLIGPELRQLSRKSKWIHDSLVVDDIFKNILNRDTPVKEISDKQVEQLENKLKEKAKNDECRMLVSLSLFRRKLLSLRRSGIKVKIPGKIARASDEPTVFHSNVLSNSSRISSIQNNFISYLDKRYRYKYNYERRLAEITISAIIFGGTHDINIIRQHITDLLSKVYLINDLIFVDFLFNPENEESPVSRWFPDPITSSLITGMALSTNKSKEVDNQLIYNCVKCIIDEVEAPAKNYTYRKNKINATLKALEPLIKLSKDYWHCRFPGVIRAYTERHQLSASIPQANLYRLLTGKRAAQTLLDKKRTDAPKQSNTTSNVLKYIPNDNYDNPGLFWNKLSNAINLDDIKQKQPKKQKKILERRIVDIYQHISDKNNTDIEKVTMPSFGSLLCNWVIHLSHNTSRYDHHLKASSISTYISTIGRSLLEQGQYLEPMVLSISGYEDLYRRIVETATRKNMKYTTDRLKDFHFFLSSVYAIPCDLDWSEVYEGDDDLYIDACIVSEKEYLLSLSILLDNTDFNERDRYIHSMILLLGYRFGLRTGEIFRITGGDIIRFNHETIVYVRNSTYGFTKTDNGVRQIPLLGELTLDENRLIDRWLSHINAYSDDFGVAALLSQLGKEREIIHRGSSIERVIGVLRAVTGDSSMRIRHLRHSFASRNFLYVYCPNTPDGNLGKLYTSIAGKIDPNIVRHTLLGPTHVSQRGLYATAVATGHGSPNVGIKHYIHLLDIATHDCVTQYSDHYSHKALAYSLQILYGNARQKTRRKDAKQSAWIPDNITLNKLRSINSLKIQDPQEVIESCNDDSKINDENFSPADIDKLLSLAGIRKTIDGFTDYFLLTEDQIKSILIIASKLQIETEFKDFGLPTYLPEDSWIIYSYERYKKLDKENSRIYTFLANINISKDILPTIDNIIRIWKSTFTPGSSYLLFTKRSDLSSYIDSMKILDVLPSNFDALLPEENILWGKIEAEIKGLGLTVKYRNNLKLAQGLSPDNRIGLILRSGSAPCLGYQRTLNRAIFSLACWREFIHSKA